jgi:hypothetical protein
VFKENDSYRTLLITNATGNVLPMFRAGQKISVSLCIDDKYYTKSEIDSFFGDVISLETVKEMIENATKRIDGGIINSGNNSTVNTIGEITENNEILINEEMLSAGTYTLKYEFEDGTYINIKSFTIE